MCGKGPKNLFLEKVIIATDDNRIKETAENFGAIVTMTSNTHLSGTDRIAEAMREESNCTHVLNIQGDEPLIDSSLIDQLCEKLSKNPDISMITAAISIKNDLDLANPNVVKTIIDKHNNAIYFAKLDTIPNQRKPGGYLLPHKGIYGYTKDFLLKFVRWDPSPLELTESLEQLRAIENGEKIHVVITEDDSIGVDTPEQALIVENQILRKN